MVLRQRKNSQYVVSSAASIPITQKRETSLTCIHSDCLKDSSNHRLVTRIKIVPWIARNNWKAVNRGRCGHAPFDR